MLVDGFPDRVITIDNKEYLYFGGTSYLGMAALPEHQNILARNIKRWGTFYGSSRSANIQLSVYDKAEKLFAKQLKAEASLTVSSGTLAGRLVIDFFDKNSKSFFHHPKAHPAILGANSLPLFMNGELHASLKNDFQQDIVITVDAISGLEVAPINFNFLKGISSQKNITLVIDESHSLGVIGENGEGIFHSIPSDGLHRKIMVASLGKALGLSGGIIASDAKFIDDLKREPVFISASGANPAYLGTYLQTQNLYERQRKQLKENMAFLFERLKSNNQLIINDKYHVIYSNNDTIFTTLLENNIVITSFKYPTYDKPMNRIVITANHTKQDLEKLIQILNNHDK
jgi:7-keto-8-aminopelargonate synthetase-like enzyme